MSPTLAHLLHSNDIHPSIHTILKTNKLTSPSTPESYIFPPTFRSGLIAHWDIPDLATWWLPHEQNLPPIIKAIRAFTGERTQKPRDHAGEEIRSMKGLFSSMSLNESPRESPDSSGSFGDEEGVGAGCC